MDRSLEEPMRQPDFTLSAGPTMAWPRVLAAQSAPITYHYDPAFLEAFRRTERKVGQLYRTKQDILVMQGEGRSSGSRGCRTRSRAAGPRVPPRRVGLVRGTTWAYWLRDFGASCTSSRSATTTRSIPAEVDRYLTEHPGVGFIVASSHSETPSGTLNPLAEIGPIARKHGCLTFVDCVSSLGGMPVLPDEWSLDICVAAAQKCMARALLACR